jgi:4,5-DOPA dioxygenase extradiol
MDRRTALKLIASTPLVAGGAAYSKPVGAQAVDHHSSGRMPSIFLAHGAPPLLDDSAWVGELHRWAQSLPRPTSILMLSAHWVEAPITIGATSPVPLVYDFYGFPERYYQVKYPAPGAPDLAMRVRALLARFEETQDQPARGLDHGAYVPLVAMYPEANVPVLQVSLPTLEPARLLEVGRRLAPLRNEGVLIVGSGFLIHNLRALRMGSSDEVPAWAKEFDNWTAETLRRHDLDALLGYRSRAPGVELALPTHEHFVPVVVAQGAAVDEAVRFPITGFAWGPMTRRSVQFG